MIQAHEVREAQWKQLRQAGAAAAKRAGIESDEELQAVLYEIPHCRPVAPRSDDRTSSGR